MRTTIVTRVERLKQTVLNISLVEVLFDMSLTILYVITTYFNSGMI